MLDAVRSGRCESRKEEGRKEEGRGARELTRALRDLEAVRRGVRRRERDRGARDRRAQLRDLEPRPGAVVVGCLAGRLGEVHRDGAGVEDGLVHLEPDGGAGLHCGGAGGGSGGKAARVASDVV